MPKKRKISTTSMIVIIILLIAIVSVTAVAWHDGKIGATPLEKINDGTIGTGTSVTVRGVITNININSVLISDGSGGASFTWAEASSLTIYSTIVVRATVNTIHTLTDVTSVEVVWLFA